MRVQTSRTSIALIAILAAALACSNLPLPPTVANIRMSTDETGATATSTYTPSQPFFVYMDLSGLNTGNVVEARWYAVNAQGVDPNLEINRSDYSYEAGKEHVYFQLNPSGNDWPTGSYRVEVYLDSTKVGELAFTVQ